MKVDGLSKEYRVLAMLDWFEYELGASVPELCIKTYYDTDVKEIKESIRGLYNRYWDILKNTFAIEPYQIDFDAHTREDCAVLLEDIMNYMNAIGNDNDAFLDKIEDSSCKWEKFLREMSVTDINVRVNSFIGTSSNVEVFRVLNNLYMIHVPLEEKLPGCAFDDLVGTIEKNISVFVTEFICKESLLERLHALISMLSALRDAYYRCGGDIRTMINVTEYENENPEIDPDEEGGLQKLFDDFKNIKEFEHYQSLLDELGDLMTKSTDPDPLKLLERYYAILDEIYFDVYSLEDIVPSLIVKYNESHGGNTK